MPIPNEIAELVSKGAGKIAASWAEPVEHAIYTKMFADHRAFDDIPAAKALFDIHQKVYEPKVNQYKNELLKTLQQGVSAPVHPRFVPHITGQLAANDVTRVATKTAQEEVFGKNRSAIQAVVRHVADTKGMNRANILSDILNTMYKEEPIKPGSFNEGKSSLDVDLRRKGGKDDIDNAVHTKLSPYRRVTDAEGVVNKARSLIAYKAALPHSVTAFLNAATEHGVINAVKSFNDAFGPGAKGKETALFVSNAISEFFETSVREEYAFKQSKISKYMPNSAGEFIHRNFFQPGMSYTRKQNLKIGAYSGKRLAEEAAGLLAAGKKIKWATEAFRKMDLDINKIASQGWQLHPEDIQKAYYHGANNLAFLNPKGNTPAFWRQSPYFRAMNSFTGFIANQAAFERRVLREQWQSGDAAGIARNIVIKTLAYPVVGSMIYEAGRLAFGADWDDPGKHLRARLENTPAGVIVDKLAGKENNASSLEILENTLDMASHIGALGQFAQTMRDTNRSELYRKFIPPEANMALQLGQDAFGKGKAIHTDSAHPHAADALKRDLLNDTLLPFGVGQILSHMIYPTKKERDKKNYHRYKANRPKPKSSNPFNGTDFNY